jgi:hypothetical protein
MHGADRRGGEQPYALVLFSIIDGKSLVLFFLCKTNDPKALQSLVNL